MRCSRSSRCRRGGRSTACPRWRRASTSSSSATPAPARRRWRGCSPRCTARWASREGPSRRGRPGLARRPVRRPDGDQDRPRDPARARRRPLHRRGLRAHARRRRPARLRRRGGRDAPEADGGPPAPARGHRRRLPAPDARVPRLEPGSALALRARDRPFPTTRPRICSRSRAGWPPSTSTSSGRARTRCSSGSSPARSAARASATPATRARSSSRRSNRQALRLARLEGAALAELSRDQVATLEADDLLEAARLLGENTDARPKRRRWLG